MPADWPYPYWIAHRGAGKRAPENTLAAFREGAAQGFRMFECDVKLSADDVPFLLHDSDLERTTSGFGIAGERPWAALSQLDAGRWHGARHAGEPIPTLAAIARFVLANGLAVNLEIKPTPGVETRPGDLVARAAGQLGGGRVAPRRSCGPAARPRRCSVRSTCPRWKPRPPRCRRCRARCCSRSCGPAGSR